MDSSEFGRCGVLRFMRQREDTIVASYPIDDDELTFGCDPSCSVRLYYPTVSPLHAKIIFQERKAFIEVIGVHGLLVDNCQVFPASTTTHTTVPLTNNSELEISKKRFRFEYPPKALRPVLAFTPPPHASQSARKRVLRLSMIQSAQVFTPRPDPDPLVNLRLLQTPIRLNSSPLKHVHHSLEQPQAGQQEGEYGTPVRLVEGNCPQVVEEEQDLVILEEVDVPVHLPLATPLGLTSGMAQPGFINPMQSPMRVPQMGGPYPAPAFPLPPSHQLQQFQTPRRRLNRPSLHRAVLIRSAQRAAMRMEMENEQEQEELEVEEHVLLTEEMEVDQKDQGDQDAVTEGFDEEAQDNDREDRPGPTTPVFGWPNELQNSIQAPRSRSRSPEKNKQMERDVVEAPAHGSEYDVHHSVYDENDRLDQDGELQQPVDEEGLGDLPLGHETRLESEIRARAVSMPRQFTPQRPARPLSFLTPQVPRGNGGLSLADRVRGRKSTGGVDRASLTRSWRVTEVAVPDAVQSTPNENSELGQLRVSDSERQAIQERRRSALAQPDMFFGGTIPGSRRISLGSGTPGAKVASVFASPTKAWAAIKEEEEETETTMLLEKMKEVVEGMQRRRSMQTDNFPVSNTSEVGDKDIGEQAETLEDDETITEEPVPPQEDSRSAVRSFPATPHMSDLKHVFSKKGAGNIPPSYAGVRDLFKADHAHNPETPRLDGVREMFFRAREREPSTPIFEGVGEMLTTLAGYVAKETTQSKEVEMESAAEAQTSAPSVNCPKGKSTVSDIPAKQGSRIASKVPRVRPMRDGRATPTDVAQLADDEVTSDVPPAKPSKHSANAPKGCIVGRTSQRPGNEAKEDTATAPVKPAIKARKVITPEVTEHAPTQLNPVVPPARRSRATTKSTESTTTESEPAESSKSMRKATRGSKTRVVSTAISEQEPEAETTKGLRRGTRKRSQSIEVAPAPVPAPATTKRRVGTKSHKAATATQDAPAEDVLPPGPADRAESPEAPPAAARGRRGKNKPAVETEDEGMSTGTLRVARGKRTPTGGAASKRATTGKGRAVPSSAKSAARAVAGEKENTPERVRVKEEEVGEKVALPPLAAKGARARKAQSEPEKDTTAAKTRAPRTRAASGRK